MIFSIFSGRAVRRTIFFLWWVGRCSGRHFIRILIPTPKAKSHIRRSTGQGTSRKSPGSEITGVRNHRGVRNHPGQKSRSKKSWSKIPVLKNPVEISGVPTTRPGTARRTRSARGFPCARCGGARCGACNPNSKAYQVLCKTSMKNPGFFDVLCIFTRIRRIVSMMLFLL